MVFNNKIELVVIFTETSDNPEETTYPTPLASCDVRYFNLSVSSLLGVKPGFLCITRSFYMMLQEQQDKGSGTLILFETF